MTQFGSASFIQMRDLVRVRSTCRLCRSPDIVLTVPLASVPIVSPNVGIGTGAGEASIEVLVAPLDTYMCKRCGLIQLIHVVDPSLIYHHYRYRTAISLGLREHFRDLADSVIGKIEIRPNEHVVEFGSNDGTLLSFFKESGALVTGIDPAKEIAAMASAAGIPTLANFFNERVAREIANSRGPARVILSNNAMANIDDLGDVLCGVAQLLSRDGIFVFETQYALDVFESCLLDVIYHEHLSCFSVTPVVKVFRNFGLEVFDAERISTKGGSIRFWVQRTGGPWAVSARVGELMALEVSRGLHTEKYHARFAARVKDIKSTLHAIIDGVKSEDGKIAGYGTSVGSAALIHQFELEGRINMLFDDCPFKERLKGPGYDLFVNRGDKLEEINPDLTILLAWRYSEPITHKHSAYMNNGGKFLVPLPKVSLRP